MSAGDQDRCCLAFCEEMQTVQLRWGSTRIPVSVRRRVLVMPVRPGAAYCWRASQCSGKALDSAAISLSLWASHGGREWELQRGPGSGSSGAEPAWSRCSPSIAEGAASGIFNSAGLWADFYPIWKQDYEVSFFLFLFFHPQLLSSFSCVP